MNLSQVDLMMEAYLEYKGEAKLNGSYPMSLEEYRAWEQQKAAFFLRNEQRFFN